MMSHNQFVLGVGSNISPETHIPMALSRLQQLFLLSAQSSIVETAPEESGLGPYFFNVAVKIDTELCMSEVKEKLLALEIEMGRDRASAIKGRHTVDLDILMWNGLITDKEVHQLSFWKPLIHELL